MIETEKSAAARLLAAEEAQRVAEAQRVVLCKFEELRRIGGELRDTPVALLDMEDRQLAAKCTTDLIAALLMFNHRLLLA